MTVVCLLRVSVVFPPHLTKENQRQQTKRHSGRVTKVSGARAVVPGQGSDKGGSHWGKVLTSKLKTQPCCSTNTDLLQRQDVEGETSPSEHCLKLRHLRPPVLHTLTHSATLWERQHTTFSKLLGVKIKDILCDALLDRRCTIDEDDARREPQLLVRRLTQTLKCINRKEQTDSECLWFKTNTSDYRHIMDAYVLFMVINSWPFTKTRLLYCSTEVY